MGFCAPTSPPPPKSGAKIRAFLRPEPLNRYRRKGKRKNGGVWTVGGHRRQRGASFFLPVQAVPVFEIPCSALKTNAQVPKNRFRRRRFLLRARLSASRTPHAPRNTTSYIIRAKSLGGIAPVVTPSPATPAVFSTPCCSPGVRFKGSPEAMNKELGVHGYGSMNGLIRLRAYGDRARDASEEESDVDQGDQEDEEESVEQLEQRIDQGLSRFEIIYPSGFLESTAARHLEDCLDSQDGLIARLEEENLTLKECLFLMEQDVNELRRRVRELEAKSSAEKSLIEQLEESCGDASGRCI